MNQIKRDCFEYVLLQLVRWYKEAHPNTHQNDISVLKALKLLFFVSAVDANNHNPYSLIDTVFDDFVAMPYGHVESEVYDMIRSGQLSNCSITNYSTVINNENNITLNVDANLAKLVDKSINSLKSINFNLINYSAFELIDLSHYWYSWQFHYQRALSMGIKSLAIDKQVIKSEEKIYNL